jgi:hypothetical protein
MTATVIGGGSIQFGDATVQSTVVFPAGTALLFQQSAAPTGWTKSTAHDNKALRVVSGVAGSGGSVAFTSAFNSTNSVDGTAISTTQMPSHSHSVYDPGHAHSVYDPGHAHSVADPGHSHGVYDYGHAHIFPGDDQLGNAAGYAGWGGGSAGGWPYDAISNLSGGGQMWYTTYSGSNLGIYGAGTGIGIYTAGANIGIYGAGTGISINSNGSDSAHSHSLTNLAVQYVDAIICTKN